MTRFDDVSHLRRCALAWQAEGVYQSAETIAALEGAREAPKGRNKYGAVRTPVDAGVADSKAEAARWAELRLLERDGQIRRLQFHPTYQLPGGVVYEADAAYDELQGGTWAPVVEDVKGGRATQTAAFRLKWRQMKAIFPHLTLRLVER
jgi:hypothetical protein